MKYQILWLVFLLGCEARIGGAMDPTTNTPESVDAGESTDTFESASVMDTFVLEVVHVVAMQVTQEEDPVREVQRVSRRLKKQVDKVGVIQEEISGIRYRLERHHLKRYRKLAREKGWDQNKPLSDSHDLRLYRRWQELEHAAQ